AAADMHYTLYPNLPIAPPGVHQVVQFQSRDMLSNSPAWGKKGTLEVVHT
ncbi:hypothetical protein A2U01_0104956, partial [Trifolium medium]|nr:hypothetical protein [Trifolium medium]